MAHKYDFNLIHVDDDYEFAERISQTLCDGSNLKGFCTYDRLPGKIIFNEAHSEIVNSDVNICVIRGVRDGTHEHICRMAMSFLTEAGALNKLIFIAHQGATASEVKNKFNLFPPSPKVIEFKVEHDPVGLMELKNELHKALLGNVSQPSSDNEKRAQTETHGDSNQMTASYARNVGTQPSASSNVDDVHNMFTGVQPSDSTDDTLSETFRSTLTEIGRELKSDELNEFKFLLEGQINYGVLQDLNSPFDVFQHMLSTNMISYKNSELLTEILNLIERNDLASKFSSFAGNQHKSNKGGISMYRKMLYQVANEVSLNDVNKLKLILTTIELSQHKLDDSKTCMDIFTLLEKEGKLFEEDKDKTYKFLHYILSQLNNPGKSYFYLQKWLHNVSLPEQMETDEPDMDMPNPYLQPKPDNEGLIEMKPGEMDAYLTKDSEKIGEGGYGIVYKGDKKYKGNDVAIKVMKPHINDKSFIREKNMAGVKHPFLIPIIAVSELGQKSLMYPFMENGDLAKVLDDTSRSQVNLGWEEVLRIIWQLARALRFLHTPVKTPDKTKRRAIRHGDVKPANILFDKNLNIRLCDTGLADEMDLGRTHNTATESGFTFVYRDPCIDEDNKHRPANDVYSFGIVCAQLIMMCSQRTLSNHITNVGRQRLIPLLKQKTSDIWSEQKKIVQALINLVERCIKPITDRETIKGVCTTLTGLAQDTAEPKVSAAKYSTDDKKCVQCLVNDRVKPLPANCGCPLFCQNCQQRAGINPLQCPKHLEETEPEIGHSQFYALLIGADIEGEKVFIYDVEDVYRTITDPKVMGVRFENVYRLIDEDENELCWKSSYYNLCTVLQTLKQAFLDKDNVTLLLYISCHANDQRFKLSHDSQIDRNELKGLLSDLHLRNLMLVLDCCCAGNSVIPFMFSDGEIKAAVLDDEPAFSIEEQGAEQGANNSGYKADGDAPTARKHRESLKSLYQMSSCRSTGTARYVNGESIFTQYLVSGLKSGHGCLEYRRSKKEGNLDGTECEFCQEFRLTKIMNQKYISVTNLHEYICDHMYRDPNSEGQIPEVLLKHNDCLKLSHYNHEALKYPVMFVDSDCRARELYVERPLMHFGRLDNLKRHLWLQIERHYPSLEQDFLEIFVKEVTKGKEFERELASPGQLKEDTKAYCRIRRNLDLLLMGPVAIPMEIRPEALAEIQQFIVGLNPVVQDHANEGTSDEMTNIFLLSKEKINVDNIKESYRKCQAKFTTTGQIFEKFLILVKNGKLFWDIKIGIYENIVSFTAVF